MWSQIIALLNNYTFQVVALGTGFLGLLSGAIGTYATLRKESLLGDALSHAALPGICIAFLFVLRKELWVLLLGASIAGLVATFLIYLMSKKTVVKFDSALSLVLSSFFGLGLVILTYLQGNPNTNQSGLANFIFGQASAMLRRDVQMIAWIGFAMLVVVALFWKEFKLFTFDPTFARTLGFSGRLVEFLMSTLLVVTIIIGLEAVGVILITALLIGPSVAARQWSNKLIVVMSLAGLIGFLSGVIGTFVSSLGVRIPTGPTIVVVLSIFVLISLFFAPNRGIIAKHKRHQQRRKNFEKELKALKEGEAP
jgi:manganese/zinc/iron transport system permease protein